MMTLEQIEAVYAIPEEDFFAAEDRVLIQQVIERVLEIVDPIDEARLEAQLAFIDSN